MNKQAALKQANDNFGYFDSFADDSCIKNTKITTSVFYNELGVKYFKQNLFAKAKHAFEKALTYKKFYKTYNNLAWVHYSNKDYENAEKCFLKALNLAPVNAEIILNCGEFYLNIKNFDKALSYFLNAITIDETNAETYFKIAKCYMEKSKFKFSAFYLEKAINYDEKNVKYLEELARIYYKQKENDKALNTFQKIIKFNPQNTWAYSNMGNIYFYNLELFDMADEYYQRAYDLNPQYCWAAYNLANVNMLYKNYNKALKLYIEACNLAPENMIFLTALAQTYYRLENIDEAISKFKFVSTVDKENEVALFYLGKIYLNHKKLYSVAQEYFEKLINLNHANAEYYYYLAKAYYKMNDKINAINNINIAILREPDNDNFRALQNMIEEL